MARKSPKQNIENIVKSALMNVLTSKALNILKTKSVDIESTLYYIYVNSIERVIKLTLS